MKTTTTSQSSCGRRTALVLLAVLFLSGCTGQPTSLEFVSSDSVNELADRHQQQVREYLQDYFGTPLNPRHRMPLESTTSDEGEEWQEIVESRRLAHGRDVYMYRCVQCHGVTGDGQGPAAEYLNPKPRDYRQGKFKFISTARGMQPLRSDLARTIRRGAKGTSMPAFRWISQEDLEAVIDYVIVLSQRGQLEEELAREIDFELDEEDDLEPKVVAGLARQIRKDWAAASEKIVLPVSRQPPFSEDSVRLGRQAFIARGCVKCHGIDARGHTQNNVGKDDWGHTVKAADLTAGMLHGGRRPIDIYRRIYAGVNGTPMPASGNQLKDEPQTLWHLTHYVMSLVDGGDVDAGIRGDEETP